MFTHGREECGEEAHYGDPKVPRAGVRVTCVLPPHHRGRQHQAVLNGQPLSWVVSRLGEVVVATARFDT